MIFIRTLAVLQSTICGTPPPLPFQQFGIAVPKAVAALIIPSLPGAVTPTASQRPKP
jgi:hypothetical protein